jgi:phosphatidylserine/phosphatidylglycerophosphate/cardiolipin synthase-like enzyme
MTSTPYCFNLQHRLTFAEVRECLRPQVYHFPASLHLKASERAAMHCKFVLADEERCFITSANFTEAAQTKNIEVGLELTGSYEPKALSSYFKALIQAKVLARLI